MSFKMKKIYNRSQAFTFSAALLTRVFCATILFSACFSAPAAMAQQPGDARSDPRGEGRRWGPPGEGGGGPRGGFERGGADRGYSERGGFDRSRGQGPGGEEGRFSRGGPRGESGGREEFRGRGEFGGRGEASGGERSFGRGGPREGGFGGPGGPGGDWVTQIDTNKNGMLDPDELAASPMRGMIERIAASRQIDLSKPVPLDSFRRSPGGESRGGDNRGGEGRSDGRSEGRSRRGESATPATPPPLVPGFEAPASASTSAVAGFDATASAAPNSSTTASGAAATPTGRAAPAAPSGGAAPQANAATSPEAEARMASIADSILKQNDANNNGTLERSEWGGLRGDPEQMDADKNGVITRDELIKYLAANFGRGRQRGGDSGNRGGDGRSGDGRGGPPQQRGSRTTSNSAPVENSMASLKRFRTATERLPDGLPGWFLDADRDRDGQVMMHEYITNWSNAKAEEFYRYDLNRDGIITPEEALKAR